MVISLPFSAVDKKKCLRIVLQTGFYLFLSSSLAFLCHRLYFNETPVTDVFTSLFAGFVFLGTLCGLFVWREFRVFIYLLIPKLFNVNGRTVLIAYISYLTLSGPVWNTTRNIGVMSTTLVCSFEEIRAAASELIDLMKEPIVYIKGLLDKMEERAKHVFADLAAKLREVQILAEKMIEHFRRATEFLKRLSSFCSSNTGSPFTYCLKTVRESIKECEVDHDSTICSPLVTLYPMCLPLIALNVFCIELDFDFLDLHFVDYLQKGFGALLAELRTFADVEVDVDGDFEVVTNKSKSYAAIRDDVAAAFGQRTATVLHYLEATRLISILFSFYLFLAVYLFRHNYLTKVHYQNRYLLRTLVEINEVREAQGDSSIFPLNDDEQHRFIAIYSWQVTYWEVVQALRGIAEVMGPFFYVVCLAFGDYALYFVMLATAEASDEEGNGGGGRGEGSSDPPTVSVIVEGEGFVANYMRSLIGTYEPIINGFNIDFGVCAPRPHAPNDDRLVLLLSLCFFMLVQSIVYPFAARVMHLIMERYYVEETRRRMAWLYNDIVRRRKTIQMLIYEKISGRYAGVGGSGESLPLLDYLQSQLGGYVVCQWLLGGIGSRGEGEFCTNCARPLNDSIIVESVKCPTYGCAGIYCVACIQELEGICIVCKKNVYEGVDYQEDLVLEILETVEEEEVEEDRD